MSEKLENNQVNEQNLEQAAGGITWMTALYRCPACQHEEERTTFARLPDEVWCPCCGATMKQVPSSIRCTED